MPAGGRARPRPFSRNEPGRAPAPEFAALNTAAAVRERCGMVHRWVAEGRSPHFTLDESRLAAVAAFVAEVTREAYPDLKIPYHSRWRHFSAGDTDRWSVLEHFQEKWEPVFRPKMRSRKKTGAHSVSIETECAPEARVADPIERTRTAVDLATVSVLLDAGAGNAWRYRERATGLSLARSEGLAIASFDMFRAGGFSSDGLRPCRVDAAALATIDAATLARHFQVAPDNPLIGLEGRGALLRRLAAALADHPDLFGRAPARPGNVVDHFVALSKGGRIPAATLLATLIESLAAIWPSGLTVDGFPLGDAGRHPAVRTDDRTAGVVPFHKLSQWLAYSLIEPLEAAGLTVTGLDALTALAEYRNGGLLVDLGVIRERAPLAPPLRHDSEPVVEWRALTVTLIDALLEPVRRELELDRSFTLPQLLQGGTWSAGRKIARQLRPPDGPPPIAVAADGTVF